MQHLQRYSETSIKATLKNRESGHKQHVFITDRWVCSRDLTNQLNVYYILNSLRFNMPEAIIITVFKITCVILSSLIVGIATEVRICRSKLLFFCLKWLFILRSHSSFNNEHVGSLEVTKLSF